MKAQSETEHTVIDSLSELCTLSKIQRLRLITHSPLKGARKMKIERLNDRHLYKVLRFMEAGWDNKRIVQVVRDTWEYKELFADELFNELGRLKRAWKQQEKQISEAQALQAAQIVDPQKKEGEADDSGIEASSQKRKKTVKRRSESKEDIGSGEADGQKNIGEPEEPKLGRLPPPRPGSMKLDDPAQHDPRAGILYLLQIELDRIDQYRRWECKEGPMLKELSEAIECAKSLEREYIDMSKKMGQASGGTDTTHADGETALERFDQLVSANISDKDRAVSVISKFTDKLSSMAVSCQPQEKPVDNPGTTVAAV